MNKHITGWLQRDSHGWFRVYKTKKEALEWKVKGDKPIIKVIIVVEEE